jgi:cell division protein FtsA
MSMRWEETLELLALRLRAADALRLATEGVFLCGGGARTPGIEELAQRIFQLPVHRGIVQSVSGPATVLENPEFATPIGLVRYGAMRAKQRPRPHLFSRLTSFAGLTSRRSS